jgi:Ankyrin repeats (3 copies)
VKQVVESMPKIEDGDILDGRTPLHIACCDVHLDEVSFLVEQWGAELEALTNGQWTHLHLACH